MRLPGTAYAIQPETSAGDSRIGVPTNPPTNPNFPRRLNLPTSAGDIRVSAAS